MGRYRKKPVVIEAVQLTHKTLEEVQEFTGTGKLADGKPELELAVGDPSLGIPTPEGLMTARYGDWIIRGVKGELYPCKPDIFEETYEPVLDESQVFIKVRSNETVKDILINYLKDSGFDGLYYPGECGCKLDDLCPCEGEISNCEPGFILSDNDQFGGQDSFIIGRKREEQTDE